MTHLISNGETTNGEAKTNEPYIPSLDRIEYKLSYFLGKLVEHHVAKKYIELERHIVKIVDARIEPVVLVADQLEAELDELKAKSDVNLVNERLEVLETELNKFKANDYVDLNGVEDHLKLRGIDELMDRDEVRELVTEIEAERLGKQDDAVDASAYAKIEDVESTVKDCIEKYNLLDDSSAESLFRDFINNNVSVSIDA